MLIKNKLGKFALIYGFIIALLLGGLPITTSYADGDSEITDVLKGRGFKEEVNLGTPATGAVLTSAVFGEEDGRPVGYTTANGGTFSAVDVLKNEVIFSGKIDGISSVWSHNIASDGRVYIAALGKGSAGTLWRYSPELEKLEEIGVPDSSHQFWSSTVDENGNVYIGTYKETEGKIFKYDADADKFVDFGKIDEVGNSSYVRSLAYHDGYVYAGLGVSGSVYKINADDPTDKIDITEQAMEILGMTRSEMGFAYDMYVVDDYLFVRFNDASAILAYHLVDGNWDEDFILGKKNDGSEEDFGSFGFTQLKEYNGKVYFINDRKLTEVDLATLEVHDTGLVYGAGWRGMAMIDFAEESGLNADVRLVNFLRDGALATIRLENPERINYPLAVSGDEPLDLHSLGLGPDGNLYITTYPGGPLGSQYNTKTGEFTTYAHGQAEGMAAGNGSDMFFGIYGDAVIQKMNTDTLEIETLFNLNDVYEQDRPYIMKFIEDKLYIGTIPDYQKLGGTITIYDPVTGERETHRNVVEDHSVVGLAVKDGLIYGSTTVRGGLDIQPTANNAKMFVWDIAKQEKVTEFELDLPDFEKSPMISGLTFDDEGLLWGAVDGHLFAMNPNSYEIVKHKNLFPNVMERGMWRPVHIIFGDDGLLYTDIAGKLVVVDSKSAELDHVTLLDSADEVSFMELAYDAEGNQNIYYINDKNHLKMIPVIDGGELPEVPEMETVELDVRNASFEEPLNDDGSIPGWSSLFADITENVSYELSDKRSASGNHSLKIMDGSDKETIYIQSDLIEVESGVEYTGSVEMFLEDGNASFMLRYYDEDENQLGEGLILHVRSGHGQWQTATVNGESPENAKYARLFGGTSQFFETSGAFYDDFRLTYEREVNDVEDEGGDTAAEITGVELFNDVLVDYGTTFDALTLPVEAEVNLDNGESIRLPILWNNGEPEYDGKRTGSYVFTGEFDLSEVEEVQNSDGIVAKLNVVVSKESDSSESGSDTGDNDENGSNDEELDDPTVEDDEADEKEQTEGGKLPKTATYMYSILLIGFVLVVVASGLFFVRRKVMKD